MIILSIPSVPPSANAAYRSQRRRQKGKSITIRTLTEEGKKYKNETKSHLVRTYPEQMKIFEPNVPYVLVVEFVFRGRDSLYSKGWNDPNVKKSVENRYKALDAGNRLKLFEDALAAAAGVDDRHNFAILLNKTWARDYESTDVWVWNREEEPSNPIDELLRSLRQVQPHRVVPSLPTGWD